MNLSGFDPRTKLMLMICVSTLAVVWQDPIWLAGLLCFTGAVLVCGGVAMGSLLKQTRGMLGVIAFLFVIQCLFIRSGPALLSVGNFTLVTVHGLTTALAVTMRLLILVLSAAILLTGDARDYLLALVQCKVPFEIAFMVMTGLHFLPILREEALDVYQAVQMRGTELAKANLGRNSVSTDGSRCPFWSERSSEPKGRRWRWRRGRFVPAPTVRSCATSSSRAATSSAWSCCPCWRRLPWRHPSSGRDVRE